LHHSKNVVGAQKTSALKLLRVCHMLDFSNFSRFFLRNRTVAKQRKSRFLNAFPRLRR